MGWPIRRLPALAGLAMAGLTALLPGHAQAQLFASEGLDPHFCELAAPRQTVVYIDDMMMVDGQTEWATKLSAKLRATLAPGERVTLVRLSPATGLSREAWSGCWPAYPAEIAAKHRAETYILSRNPLDRLGDQQRYFLQSFGTALTQIYLDAKRPATAVRFTAGSAPPKQILRALGSDDGRFVQSKTTLRAIVYSDMAENSDLGSALKPIAAGPAATTQSGPGPASIGPKIGVYFRHGVFYGFGLGADIVDSPAFPENARGFWNAAIRSMASTVAALGADLNVPDTVPVRSFARPVELDLDGQTLDGRLTLTTDAQGNLVDSWIGISRLSSATLTGTYVCRSAPEGASCQVNAATSNGITTRSPTETLTLSGSEAAGLHGRLGVIGSKALFSLHTTQDGS
jgi:hypothetical protein